MPATVIDLNQFRRRAGLAAVTTSFRDQAKEKIAQVIMQDYSDWPWPVVEQAIAAAKVSLDTDGTFLDAIEASEQVFVDNRRRTDHGRLALLEERRKHRRDAFFKLASREIKDRLAGKASWLERHYALVRARRVIDGGGTIGAALRHALGPEWLA